MMGFARRAAAAMFTLALFSSAALIFMLQPLVGRLVTPLLGGAPAVWNTSMVFFQAALLVGYVYAHALARLKDVRLQAAIHAVVLIAAWLVLPIRISGAFGAPSSAHPELWLLGVLTLSVGAPFAAASATAPLLQAWYARTGRADARDPYYLYAASNLGSFIGLLAYPILVEPLIGLTEQRGLWGIGYAVVAALILAAGVLAAMAQTDTPPAPAAPHAEASPPWRERLFWLAAAAVPSSLILGVTQHISTDIASAPFLWVVPLALYLLTFVIAFARGSEKFSALVLVAQPLAIAILVASYFARNSVVWTLGANLVGFFLSALVCHMALARARPGADRLTEFYFWVSLGGVVGGALTALAAPVLFDNIYEYPLALAAVALFRPRGDQTFRALSNVLAISTVVLAAFTFLLIVRSAPELAVFGGGVGAAAALLAGALPAQAAGRQTTRQIVFVGVSLVFALLMTYALAFRDALVLEAVVNGATEIGIVQPLGFIVMALAFITLAFVVRASLTEREDAAAHPIATDIALGVALPAITLLIALLAAAGKFQADTVFVVGLGVAAIALLLNRMRPRLLASLVLVAFVIVFLHDRGGGHVIDQQRSFFGVLRTEEFAAGRDVRLRVLMHGTTIHGAQLHGAPGLSRQPLTYYNPQTSLGEAIVAGLSGGETSRLALIGLGTGTTACLLRPNDQLTIFEIDPKVVTLSARPGRDFTYVPECQPHAQVRLGDARLELAREPAHSFDVIVVDAFSSDAIPAHLLTREALAMYLSKTSDRGIVVLHLSNRNLALVSEASRLAHSLNAAFVWRVSNRVQTSNLAGAGFYAGLPASTMVLARTPEILARTPLRSQDWHTLPAPPGRPWSDEYINLARALYENMNGVESCLQGEAKLDCRR